MTIIKSSKSLSLKEFSSIVFGDNNQPKRVTNITYICISFPGIAVNSKTDAVNDTINDAVKLFITQEKGAL